MLNFNEVKFSPKFPMGIRIFQCKKCYIKFRLMNFIIEETGFITCKKANGNVKKISCWNEYGL